MSLSSKRKSLIKVWFLLVLLKWIYLLQNHPNQVLLLFWMIFKMSISMPNLISLPFLVINVSNIIWHLLWPDYDCLKGFDLHLFLRNFLCNQLLLHIWFDLDSWGTIAYWTSIVKWLNWFWVLAGFWNKLNNWNEM